MLQLLKVRIYLIPSALQTPSEQLQLEKTLGFAPRSTLVRLSKPICILPWGRGADGATPTCPYPAASADLRAERRSWAKPAAGKNVRSEFKQALSSGGAGKRVDFVQLNIVEEVELNRVKSPRSEEMNTRAEVLPYSVICHSCSPLTLPMSWPESHVRS